MISQPDGVCSQPLVARFQNAEKSVPGPAHEGGKECAQGGAGLQPNRSPPRKTASRKNALAAS